MAEGERLGKFWNPCILHWRGYVRQADSHGGVEQSGTDGVNIFPMAFPIKICAICSEEFELKPGKPGFANRCPACSEPEAVEAPAPKRVLSAEERKAEKEADAARRKAIRDLLYRKES